MNRRDFLCASVALPVSAAIPAFAAPVVIRIDLAVGKSLGAVSLGMVYEDGHFKIERIWISDECVELMDRLKRKGYSIKLRAPCPK